MRRAKASASPYTISQSQVFEGSLISVAGTTLNTLVQLDPIYVSLNPAEANLAAINRAQARAPIEAAVSIGSGQSSHAGAVTFLDNQVDRLTGTILLRATIANADHALISGPYVTARLNLGDRDDALLVPQTAVGSTQLGRTLMVVGADDKAEQRIVKLGDGYDDMIMVTDGLKAGDRVITGEYSEVEAGNPGGGTSTRGSVNSSANPACVGCGLRGNASARACSRFSLMRATLDPFRFSSAREILSIVPTWALALSR